MGSIVYLYNWIFKISSINVEAGVRFLPFTGPLLESMGEYNMTVILDGEISSNVSVTVFDNQGNHNTDREGCF